MARLLLHVSDIHAKRGQLLEELASSITRTVKEKFVPEFLIASGDLGFQGAGAEYGARFIRSLAQQLSIPPQKIVCCPGNHDIQSEENQRSFREYNRAVGELLIDSERAAASSRPCSLYTIDGVGFLVVNSAYHGDWQYGRVDIDNLEKAIAQISPDHTSTRIAVVHHHSIPVNEDDRSEIVNAYPFLNLLAEKGFDILVHGHRHMAMSIRVGGKTKIIGVGTVNYPPETNVNNQFNVIEVRKRVVRFRYYRDSVDRGSLAAWSPSEEEW